MRIFTTLIFLIITAASTVCAEGYPRPQSQSYVNDFANLLSSSDEAEISRKLINFKKSSGIEFKVITIKSMAEYKHHGAIEPFATKLFNAWGIGDPSRKDGVMLLVSHKDRKLRIEVGPRYGKSKNSSMKRIIDKTIVPNFKQGDFSHGISVGVDAVIDELSATKTGLMDQLREILDLVGKWIYLTLIAPFIGVIAMVRHWLRNRPRICPTDGSKMSKLAEHWDDRYLQDGQILEENLNSIDYDVWQCSKCDHTIIEAYKSWFSRYKACKNCQYKTVESDSTVLQAATSYSSGRKRIDYTCKNCNEQWSVEKIIPVKKSSSSSFSSSGGSSGGGGASGSW